MVSHNMVSQNGALTKDQANTEGYRQNRGYQADRLVYGDVTISFSAMEVHRAGQLVALTPKEFKTLAYLLKNARRVISRDELLNEVWGHEFYPCTRTVDNHILHLRKKLEPEPARPKHFRTVRGIGYKFLA
jgi:DNA-binding response OmpR family regulator